MKKILLSGIFGIAMVTGLTGIAGAQYYPNNYQYSYPYNTQNTAYTVRQISSCLSYKYNYYGLIIDTVNTCNNYNSYPAQQTYPSYPCSQVQIYPYMNNNCNSNYNSNYSNYPNNNYQNYQYNYSSSYPSYSNYNSCDYYYYDNYGNYSCGTYSSNTYYPYMNYTPTYTPIPTNYYPYYYGY